ncbi:UNVERIFIED_CONTAM: hypothetical protein FKN15_018332 [Acipenser sinensis]
MAKEEFYVIHNPTTGEISEDTSKKEKPKRDRNVCGSKSIVVLYILLMATSMVWMILLYKVFAKHSEISAEIENLRNSRTILKGNDSEISAEIENLRNSRTILKGNVTEEIRNLRVEQTLMKEKDSKIMANVTNLENYVSKVCAINTCPSEWTLFSGKCYYFSNENRDWKKAREFCQSQDSDLAVINSDEELNYLKGKVRVAHLVGMSDLETEGVWKWLDGSLVDGSGKCYYFSNENRDWKKAREFCQSQDSDLAVINSDEELVGDIPSSASSLIIMSKTSANV